MRASLLSESKAVSVLLSVLCLFSYTKGQIACHVPPLSSTSTEFDYLFFIQKHLSGQKTWEAVQKGVSILKGIEFLDQNTESEFAESNKHKEKSFSPNLLPKFYETRWPQLSLEHIQQFYRRSKAVHHIPSNMKPLTLALQGSQCVVYKAYVDTQTYKHVIAVSDLMRFLSDAYGQQRSRC